MSLEAARLLGIDPAHYQLFGPGMGKVSTAAIPSVDSARGRLILVSAITPTPAGEGKTTTSIGLADGLRHIGQKACVALREPSLGPCFGLKGGGTGGGRAQLVPSDRINLHFTGDFHAIGAAHNLLSASLDNHIHWRSDLNLDLRRINWPRVLDVNDRSLRHLVLGLGGRAHGMPREAGFDITAASELMAMVCLADGFEDLRERIDRVLIGFDRKGEPMRAARLNITGAMLALLRDALQPNLVETREGTPAFVHGGPFANIAHGCNSVLATRAGLGSADWVVTEAGFGFDLGAEKFFDIKCRSAGLDPAAVVLVATVRALKHHGGVALSDLAAPDPGAVERGIANLDKHLESIAAFNKPALVAINRRAEDDPEEIEVIRRHCEERGVGCIASDHFASGGAGAAELAEAVVTLASEPGEPFAPLYELDESIPDKLHKVARAVYGADDVEFTKGAARDLADLERLGLSRLPICVAKTHSSLSDDPRLLGRPHGFELTVRSLIANAGAGFVVVLTGEILRMPGLPRTPQAERIDLVDGEIVGLR